MSETETPDLEARHARAAHLKERIYVTFAALAVVIGLLLKDAEAAEAIRVLGVTIGGLLAAVFVADVLSHLVVHERPLTAAEWRLALLTSFGAVGSLALPFLFLGLAVLGVWSAEVALRASEVALIAALVGIGWLAVRRLRLRWWQRLFALGGEAVIGLAVVGLQVLAH
ncbi:MAG: hypothetical protein DI534_10255 [Leifsonia xyli]|nr:MAG: hypothetical protein DI534_10255 [Leifsonia xyli]